MFLAFHIWFLNAYFHKDLVRIVSYTVLYHTSETEGCNAWEVDYGKTKNNHGENYFFWSSLMVSLKPQIYIKISIKIWNEILKKKKTKKPSL